MKSLDLLCSLRGGMAAAGGAMLLFVAPIAYADSYVPITSHVTGNELGRASRADGSTASAAQFASAQGLCAADHREVTRSLADSINELAKRDRELAQLALIKATNACLQKKGWRVELNTKIGEPSAPVKAAVDVGLTKLAAELPMPMDQHTDLVSVKRVNADIVYTTKVRDSSSNLAQQWRQHLANDPQTAKAIMVSLMKQRVCEPEPAEFLREGFGVVYEMTDRNGLLSRTRLVLSDCK